LLFFPLCIGFLFTAFASSSELLTFMPPGLANFQRIDVGADIRGSPPNRVGGQLNRGWKIPPAGAEAEQGSFGDNQDGCELTPRQQLLGK
jgi:hypothetical protein